MEEKRKSELEMASIKMSHLAKLANVSPTSALDPERETVKNNSGKRRKIKHKQSRLDEEG